MTELTKEKAREAVSDLECLADEAGSIREVLTALSFKEFAIEKALMEFREKFPEISGDLLASFDFTNDFDISEAEDCFMDLQNELEEKYLSEYDDD